MQTSGAAAKKAAIGNPKYYQMMVKQGEDSPFYFDIESDNKLTFARHPWLSSEDGRAARTRVLSAYSVHNEKVGPGSEPRTASHLPRQVPHQ